MSEEKITRVFLLWPCHCGLEPRISDEPGSAIHVTCRCGIQLWGARNHFGSKEDCAEEWNKRHVVCKKHTTKVDHDALVAAVCVLRSQGLGNLSEAVEMARALLEGES